MQTLQKKKIGGKYRTIHSLILKQVLQPSLGCPLGKGLSLLCAKLSPSAALQRCSWSDIRGHQLRLRSDLSPGPMFHRTLVPYCCILNSHSTPVINKKANLSLLATEAEHFIVIQLQIVPLPTLHWKNHGEPSDEREVITVQQPGPGLKPATPNFVFTTNSAVSLL